MAEDTWLPRFWKLSQGAQEFTEKEILQSIETRFVYVHSTTAPKGGAGISQGRMFMEAPIGDYFYLTHGNKGIYLLGQFSGPPNIFCAWGGGWVDRPFRLIRLAEPIKPYKGPKKWWTPNENSTFVRIPDEDLGLFEECILIPHFRVALKDFGIRNRV
ncbi:MAG: hypothetical protein NUV77_21490 [Thermoguttaceae bacterium]|jgi:hypothetical protein|nr:hypothetical protein [Thermoguttaceae bacterium]